MSVHELHNSVIYMYMYIFNLTLHKSIHIIKTLAGKE